MPKSNRPTVRIHNIETDEIIDREMTDDEFTQYQAEAEIKAEAKVEDEAKASARVEILNRLGLTAEEAAILLG
jgi:hypothetical protein